MTELTAGPVRKRLSDLWLPMIGGVLAVKAIGVSDAYFIGQLGEQSLAAISFTFPVVMTLISLAIGLSSGASSVLSQAVGRAGNQNEKRRIVAGAVMLGALFAMAVGGLGALVNDPLFRLMGADGAVLAEIRAYMLIWFAGLSLLIVPIIINGILRATGDGVSPALLMGAIAIVNIALNPLFIFGVGPIPALEIAGAAVATLIARAMAFVIAIALLFRRKLFTFDLSIWRSGFDEWKGIIRVAGPAAGSTAMNPFAVSIATAAVATLGDAAVAGFGVASKIQSIALVPLLALSAAAAPMAGQNSAAHKEDRTRTMLQWCHGVSVVWAILAAGAFWLFREPLTAAFSDSVQAQDFASRYLLIVPLSFMGYGAVIATSAALNGLGRSFTAFFLAGGRAMALLAPGAWIGVKLANYWGFAGAIAFANIASGAVALIITRYHALSVRGDVADDGAGREDTE